VRSVFACPGPFGEMWAYETDAPRTPQGVWPLGDAPEWAFAVAADDDLRQQRVLERVGMVASADGMLPETYGPDTAAWVARHWFAWPGSLLGTLNGTYRRGGGPGSLAQ
jgi:meiotically up-regulated gene 157 (Mug157) protein